MDSIKAPDLSNIRADKIELKKMARVLTKRVHAAPPPPLPMRLLETLTVDIKPFVPKFYTPTRDVNDIDIYKV